MMRDFSWPLMNRVELYEVSGYGYSAVGLGVTLAHAIMDFMMCTHGDYEYMVQSVGTTQVVLNHDILFGVLQRMRSDPEVPEFELTLNYIKRIVYIDDFAPF